MRNVLELACVALAVLVKATVTALAFMAIGAVLIVFAAVGAGF